MANFQFNNVKIAGISACVPKNISSNLELLKNYPAEEAEKIIKNVGIKEKRYVDHEVTASDLCYKAADTLLNEMNIDRSSIDMLIFLSQLPDYRIPHHQHYKIDWVSVKILHVLILVLHVLDMFMLCPMHLVMHHKMALIVFYY